MSEATRPKFFNIPSLKLSEETAKKGASEEETAIYAMSRSKGWSIFSDFISRLIDELDQTNEEAIAKGLSFEDIGRNTIVISLTKDIIKRMMNKVQDAKDVCEGDK